MKYTGPYKQREQAQRKVTLSRIIRIAARIESTDTLTRLLLVTQQIQHTDSGRATKAEKIRDIINIWTVYHDDIEELELMKGLVIEVATMKARKAQRVVRTA